ncbi:MAG: hypothetical protein JXA67_10340 [Micromonosporaceae bacterium]|nr:hypothetical protein [Micromonosporaceae bacterium]
MSRRVVAPRTSKASTAITPLTKSLDRTKSKAVLAGVVSASPARLVTSRLSSRMRWTRTRWHDRRLADLGTITSTA